MSFLYWEFYVLIHVPFLNCVICFVIYNFLITLYILDTTPIVNIEKVRFFLHSIGSFIQWQCHLLLKNSFIFMRSNLLLVSAWTIGVLFRKSCPTPWSGRLFSTLSSKRFSETDFMLMPLIQLNLSVIGWEVRIYLHFSTYRYPVGLTSTSCGRCWLVFHMHFCLLYIKKNNVS